MSFFSAPSVSASPTPVPAPLPIETPEQSEEAKKKRDVAKKKLLAALSSRTKTDFAGLGENLNQLGAGGSTGPLASKKTNALGG